jgi:acyl carrier protein
MPASNEIDARVSKVLVQALGVDEEDITPRATLKGELGAESIDFLDIVFRLEREFGIRIPRGELFSELVFESTAEIVQDGQVTDLGLAALRAHMPFADWSELERDRRLSQIDDVFTVSLLTRYVASKLARDDEAKEGVAASARERFAGILPPSAA